MAKKSFTAKAPKAFLFQPLAFGKLAVVFVPCMSFQPSLIFAGKARSRAYPWSGSPKSIGSSLSQILHYSWTDMLWKNTLAYFVPPPLTINKAVLQW